jgi:uncharacterized protein YbjT (DUF2867 family)
MDIIVGATGQIGKMLIRELKQRGREVRAVVRDPLKIADNNIDILKADIFNVEELAESFKGGTTVFLLTPENPASDDILKDTKQIVENYITAIESAGIKRVVGLSCIGAHLKGKTGNVLMSGILEEHLDRISAEKIFIRPCYYFSNWLGFIEPVEQYGVLPTFFPENLKIDMLSSSDLAKFIADIMVDKANPGARTVYELTGPQMYSSADVAMAFSKVLGKKVTAQSIPGEKWKETLISAGFTFNTADNIIDMTQAVIDEKIVPERPTEVISLTTTLEEYLEYKLIKE